MTDNTHRSTHFSNKPICCDMPGCTNLGTEMFDEEADYLSTFPVCICRKCKEEW